MHQVCSTRVGAVVGVPFPVPVRRPGSHHGTFVGDGGLAGKPPVVGPCLGRARWTGSPQTGLRRSRCGVLPAQRCFVRSTVPMSVACPLALYAGHACLPLPGTACVVRTASAVWGVPHCGNAPAVPPSAPCVVPVQWRRLSVHVPVAVLEGRDCTRYFRAVGVAVKPQRFRQRGWGGGGWAGIRGRAGGPAVDLGACRCSRNSACAAAVVQARPVAAQSDRGFGHRVCLC